MKFRYDNDKNTKLKIERRVEFEDIIDAITRGNLILIEEHPNIKRYPNQELMHVKMEDEVYVVPFVEEADGTFFLKTAYPSRKARKKFLESKGKDDTNNNTTRSLA